MTETKTVHFSIDGGDLTRLIRNLVLEGAPGRAWRVATSMNGEGVADAALKILRGTHRFRGNESSIVLVPEDPETMKAYQEQAHYVYAGIYRHQDRWCRPVAEVTNYGPDDMHNDHGKRVRHEWRGSQSCFVNRTWHYCGPDEFVIEEPYIFGYCHERPHWMNEVLSARDAIAETRAAGRDLEKRGWAAWYGDNDRDDAAVVASNAAALTILTQHEVSRVEAEAYVDASSDSEDRTERKYEMDVLLGDQQDRRWQARIASIRAEVLEQAGDDLFELSWKESRNDDGEIIVAAGKTMVPRAPFIHWCVDRHDRLRHLAPPWSIVSPPGMKLPMDDPYHTDWMIGAGLDLAEDSYGSPVADAAMEKRFEIVETLGETDCLVLVEGGDVGGIVHHGVRNKPSPVGAVVVLPNLHPAYLKTVVTAAAIITEAGGATAHLAQISRERALPIVLVKDARKRYPEGARVYLDLKAGRVSL